MRSPSSDCSARRGQGEVRGISKAVDVFTKQT